MSMDHNARWWEPVGDGRLRCDVCPRACKLRDGQRGFCFVRKRVGDAIVLETYGRSSGFCVDPIEKKPLHHFYPGSSVLSFGTAGCNLGCKFCQNWDISKARETDRLTDRATGDDLAQAARRLGCRSIAFTYNDPVIFAEYAIDVAAACREAGVATVAVTAGYVNPEPRREFFAAMDAANVDLKGFTDEFYATVTGARLATVLDTLAYVKHETDVWLEITTLLIPGLNDATDELERLCRWVHDQLGADVPLHFSAFHPDHRMRDLPRTPAATLTRARRIGLDAGLRYVYTGNVVDADGDTTWCPGCGRAVITRDWYEIVGYDLTPDGHCPACGTTIPGRFAPTPGSFGRRRIPVRIAW